MMRKRAQWSSVIELFSYTHTSHLLAKGGRLIALPVYEKNLKCNSKYIDGFGSMLHIQAKTALAGIFRVAAFIERPALNLRNEQIFISV